MAILEALTNPILNVMNVEKSVVKEKRSYLKDRGSSHKSEISKLHLGSQFLRRLPHVKSSTTASCIAVVKHSFSF
jgi:hypothetical protein